MIDTLRRGVAAVPSVLIAVVLLAGPTAALIGYRIMGYRMMVAARRAQSLNVAQAIPLWVCHDCRSVNQLRAARCYRCGIDRDSTNDIEVILDLPTASPTFFEVPAGSPFAALGSTTRRTSPDRPGVPVMADPSSQRRGVAVGPGQPIEAPALPSQLGRERVRVGWPTPDTDEGASADGPGSRVDPRT